MQILSARNEFYNHLKQAEKHSQTIFTIEILIKILAASTCMIDFFCKSMAASNFCDDSKSAQRWHC